MNTEPKIEKHITIDNLLKSKYKRVASIINANTDLFSNNIHKDDLTVLLGDIKEDNIKKETGSIYSGGDIDSMVDLIRFMNINEIAYIIYE